MKEAPAWRVTVRDENNRSTAEFVTHISDRYRSTAPQLPGAPLITISELGVRVDIALTDCTPRNASAPRYQPRLPRRNTSYRGWMSDPRIANPLRMAGSAIAP
jgi:hypothetical protein